MHTIAVVRSCKAKVCSCNLSCSCGCVKPPFEVVLSVVAGLKSPFVLAVVPGWNPLFAVALAVVCLMWDAVAVAVALVRWGDIAFAVALYNCAPALVIRSCASFLTKLNAFVMSYIVVEAKILSFHPTMPRRHDSWRTHPTTINSRQFYSIHVCYDTLWACYTTTTFSENFSY